MNKVNIGLIGYGNVGSGVVKFLQKKKNYFREKFAIDFIIKTICDRRIDQKLPQGMGNIRLTKDMEATVADPDLDVIIELIGGLHPARELISSALKQGKHIITANKQLLANYGQSLFEEALTHDRNIYFESSVMAGVPVIKTITEGLVGNRFTGLYGIINGTCNYILSEMTKNKCSFAGALQEAQKKGFAESDPTLDLNGMDAAHKLAILVSLAFGKFIKLKDIHVEGITHISQDDIEYAESLGLTIKLLAIAKKDDNQIEAHVHPTLISEEHPLGSINGVYNAIFMATDPLGDLLLSGEGAGQMAATSGVISDLVNLASRKGCAASQMLGNISQEDPNISIKTIDQISTKYYFRFMATDKPGVLSKITGILGDHNIGINSVTQKAHNRMATVPVIILTESAPEEKVRQALEQIHKLPIVKSKPVAIRMENI